jgi:hypothetical protein
VTKDLQEQLYPIAKERFPDLDELISMQRVRDYFHLLSPHKQKRTITKLLEIKKQCEIAKKPVVEWKTMDYTTIFPHFSKLLEENDSDHYR